MCWSAKLFLLFLGLLGFSSCHISSSSALEGRGGRTSYNSVLQETNSEQMLLNLVRLRYFDTPFFLNVGTITTQFTFKTSANTSFKIPGFDHSHPVSIGGDVSWQNQPTIQYTPLQGQAFAKQLLHPMDLRTLQQLILSGWDIDLVFKLAVQSFDDHLNAPEASGPIPEYVPRYKSFFEVTQLFRYFQKRSELQVGVSLKKCKNDEREIQTLQIAFPKGSEQAKRLAELLPLIEKENNRYVLTLELGFTQNGKIGIMPRSVLSCMYYLSTGVRLPREHMEMGKVAVTVEEDKEDFFDWKEILGQLIHIHCGQSCPQDAYVCVRYKNTWFYIRDNDISSKLTFLLLLQIYNLQAEDKKVVPPVLTLPLG